MIKRVRYRNGLSESDLAGYSDQVKQAFSLVNGSYNEVYRARVQEIINM